MTEGAARIALQTAGFSMCELCTSEKGRPAENTRPGIGGQEGGEEHLAHIHAVHQHARHAEGRTLLVYVWRIVSQAGACGSGVVHANRPFIVFHHKDAGQLVQRCHVQALVELSCNASITGQLEELRSTFSRLAKDKA